MSGPLCLGVIGCGQAASEYHWPFWHELRDAAVTAVCDLDPGRASAAAKRFGARAFASPELLLDEADIDALFIFVPPFAHGDLELRAAERGLPFFVEKPVGLDLLRAQRTEAEVAARGVMTSVGYDWRYSRAVERARTELAGREIALLQGFWLGSALGGSPPSWWTRQELSGGQLVEQATHIVDLLVHLGGEVRQVNCRQAPGFARNARVDVAGAGAVLVEMASGAVGAIVSACGLPHPTLRCGLVVSADGLHVEVTRQRARLYRGGERETYDAPTASSDSPYLREDQAFVDAVRSGDPSGIRCSYADGVRTLAVCLAANESARTGRPVAPAALTGAGGA